MRHVLIGLCLSALLAPGLRAADAEGDQPTVVEAPTPATPAATPAQPVNTLSIPDAVEGILDEDEPTRKKAFNRLENATAADIPALEKYEQAQDPEINRQVALVLQRLRRGELAVFVRFADGAPAANLKVNVKVTEVKMPEVEKKPEEKKTDGKAADAAKPGAVVAGGAAGNGVQIQQIQVAGGGQVQIQVAGGAAGPVIINGVPARGQMTAQPTYKEILNAELTTDAAGKLVLGRFNDGKYKYQVAVNDGLPNQSLNGEIDLTAASQPLKWEVRHGLNATITLLDADGQPLTGATVIDLGQNTGMKMSCLRMPPQQAQRFLRNVVTAVTDEKGQAVLEGVGIYDINLIVLKDGYEPVVQDKVACEDGKPLALSLKMEKIKPTEITITLRDLEKVELKGYHFIQIASADYQKVLAAGADPAATAEPAKEDPAQAGQAAKPGFHQPEAAKFDQYIKAGARDLGKVDDNLQLKLTVLPGNYMLLGVPEDKSQIRLGNFNYTAGMKNIDPRQLQAHIRQVPKPGQGGRAIGGLGGGIRPMPAPMPPVQNLPAPAPDANQLEKE